MADISRQYTIADLLAEVNDTRSRLSTVACGFQTWLEQNKHLTIEQYRTELQSNLMWGPAVCEILIQHAFEHNTEKVGKEIQIAYAGYFVKYPFQRIRAQIEAMLANPVLKDQYGNNVSQGLCDEAKKILIDCVIKNHPRAKDFLMQHTAKENFHKGFDPSKLPGDVRKLVINKFH
jgi:hypothetical protein